MLLLELLVLRILTVGAFILGNRGVSIGLSTSFLGLRRNALRRLLVSTALALGCGRSRSR